MMFGVVLALSLAGVPRWEALDEPGRASAMRELQRLPTMRERVLSASERFLGTAYVASPLGEGSGRDPDPLARFDAVDCLTLVEQCLALASAEPEHWVERLTALRYRGEPSWDTRLHVMEAQWLPENLRRGVVQDVTASYGKTDTKHVTKQLTEATWKEQSAERLGLTSAARPIGTFGLDIIPASAAVARLKDAPSGLLVVVVRADRPWLVTRVSHVGVLVQGPKGPMLRHASRSFKRVVDEPLGRYVSRNLDFGTWTIEGLAIFEPLLPAPEAGVR